MIINPTNFEKDHHDSLFHTAWFNAIRYFHYRFMTRFTAFQTQLNRCVFSGHVQSAYLSAIVGDGLFSLCCCRHTRWHWNHRRDVFGVLHVLPASSRIAVLGRRTQRWSSPHGVQRGYCAIWDTEHYHDLSRGKWTRCVTNLVFMLYFFFFIYLFNTVPLHSLKYNSQRLNRRNPG